MEKVLEHYVQRIYRGSTANIDVTERIPERSPMFVEEDVEMQGFRFFDVDPETSERKDYSGWVFFGKRLSFKDVLDEYGDADALTTAMQEYGYSHVCRTRVGTFLPMADEDLTMDEYSATLPKENHK